MKRFLLSGLIMILSTGVASADEFRKISPDYTPQFPNDFYYKEGYRVQWWYFTGHLFDREGREFGYELTFFAVGVQTRAYKSKFGVDNIYISHFALTDVAGKRYYSSEKSDSGAYGFAGAEVKDLRVWVDDNKMEGTTERIHIAALDRDRSFELELTPAKRVVLNGQKGFSRKSEDSPAIASWYFSYTDLATSGSLKIGDKTFSVHGKSWFDREISSGRMGKSEEGWDWFAIQLDDGREVMIYIMRKADGTADKYSSGTFVYRDGKYRHLNIDDFSITSSRHYKSARTGAQYPSQWEIRIPGEGLTLKVTPLLEDQEFIATTSTGNYYWEGTCRVEGSAAGRAYVELTGY